MTVQTTHFTKAGDPAKASTDLVGGRFVKYGGTDELTVSYADAAETANGIIGSATDSGLTATIHRTGRGRLEVNGSSVNIAPGDYLKPSANGIGVKASTGDVATAVAREASTASGDEIAVDVITPTVVASLANQLNQPYVLPIEGFRIHDDLDSPLPETAATDDLAIIEGVFGTSAPKIQSLDFGGTSTTAYARIRFALPPEYVGGEAITLRVNAGMETTIADTSATLDAEVYSSDDPSTDICATDAQSINNLTAADVDFTITPTGKSAGDVLDVRLAFAGVDAGNAGVMTGAINSAKVLLTIDG